VLSLPSGKEYERPGRGTIEDRELRAVLYKSFQIISKDPSTGKQIRHSLIPKIYLKKYGIDNLWKYDLPHGWRLVYSLAVMEGEELCLIVE